MVTAFVLSRGGSLGAVQVGKRPHEPACFYPVGVGNQRSASRASSHWVETETWHAY